MGKLTDIIIVNYHTEDFLAKCVRSIRNYTPESAYHLIIVDNGSHKNWDPSWPNLTFIKNANNMGLAKAWNQGIQAGLGEYILLLNPDVQVTPLWLEGLVKCAASAERVGVVGCKHVNRHGKIVHAGLDFNGRYRYKRKSATHYGLEPSQCLSVSGGCFLIKRANLTELGHFDPKYFLYYEDTDYAVRAWHQGFKVLYCPVQVLHDSHGSPIPFQVRKKYIQESRCYFRNKWHLRL